MAELVAQGENAADHWRRPLAAGERVVLGRGAGTWAVPWDACVSRRQAELEWHDGRLRVRQAAGAKNPIWFRGKEATAFELAAGECFVVGRTVFLVSEDTPSVSPDGRPVVQSRSVSAQELQRIPFRDAPHRLDVLSRLPDVIASAADEQELCLHLVNLLLAGIPRADAIAVVVAEGEGLGGLRVLHWDGRRLGGRTFQPSRRLVHEALGRLHKTVLHLWAPDKAGEQPAGSGTTFTMQGDFDWAFCTPVRGPGGEGEAAWGLYVTGRFTGDVAATLLVPWENNDLGDDLKFAELAGSILGSLRQVRRLQREQAALSRFFSPAVQKLLRTADAEQALRPREADVTVLFGDLRGFSRKVETAASDLPGVLERVSQALGVMTVEILGHEGVVADFLGDAAMGFWGWPVAQADMTAQACLAALGTRTFYESLGRQPEHPLAGFRVGLGLATGRAVAGRIGPREQAKVTVFGPVVNLASRLQDMTKLLKVPILMDEATAQVVRERVPRETARCRRLARVRPFGLERALTVSELLPPEKQYPQLTDAHLEHYEAALEAFLRGEWGVAYEHLHQVPPKDLAKDLLTSFIIQNNHVPPAGWDGVIPLGSKG